MENGKKVKPISSYDLDALKKEFDKIPNPEKTFEWKMIRLTDYLLGHKKYYVRWPGTIFAILIAMPFFLIYNKIYRGRFIPK